MTNFDEYILRAIRALFRCLGRIPRKTAKRIGAFMGRLLFLLDKKHRRITLENLSRAFGRDKGPEAWGGLGRRVFENLGQILFEIGWATGLAKKDFNKHFEIRGLENLKKAFEKNRGVLILTAHVGNWELLTNIAAMTGFPLSIVVRPLDFGPLELFFRDFRTQFGAELIPTKNSMRMILRGLAKKHMVALLLDQNVDWYDGVFVSFFGRPACTNRGLALLAMKTGAPVVPVFLVRGKSGFFAEFGPEVPVIKTGDKTADVESNTQTYNDIIEAFVRRYPEQWFWVHQRWKTRPYHPWPAGKSPRMLDV